MPEEIRGGEELRRRGWGRALEILTSSRAKRIYFVLAALLVAFLWYNMVRRALQQHGSQFDDFVNFSRDLVFRRVNVYEEYPLEYTITKYPPFFSLLFAPLVPLPRWMGASIWFWVSLGLAVAATYLSVRTVAERDELVRGVKAMYVLPFLLTAGIIGSNLETAQVNTVTLFLLCLSLYWFKQRKDISAGAVLGVVTALKLTPGLFVVYFLYKRALRVVVGAAAAIVVCWLIIPPLVFGPGNFVDIVVDWYGILTGFITEGTLAEGIQGFRDTNQSLSAAFHRFFTEVPARWVRSEGGGELYLNVLALNLRLADLIIKGMVVSILIFLAWMCRTPAGDRRNVALGFEYALVFIATLFISPISWINHYVFLLFPYAVAVYYIRTRPRGSPERRILLYLVIASFVLVSSSVSRLMQALSLPFLGALVLAVGLAVSLRAEQGKEVRSEI